MGPPNVGKSALVAALTNTTPINSRLSSPHPDSPAWHDAGGERSDPAGAGPAGRSAQATDEDVRPLRQQVTPRLADIAAPSLDIHSPLWYLDTEIPEGDNSMKAMTLRLDEREYERLRTLAFVEDRAMTDVIREAIREYIQHKASHDEFRASLERAMQENAQLIAELAQH